MKLTSVDAAIARNFAAAWCIAPDYESERKVALDIIATGKVACLAIVLHTLRRYTIECHGTHVAAQAKRGLRELPTIICDLALTNDARRLI